MELKLYALQFQDINHNHFQTDSLGRSTDASGTVKTGNHGPDVSGKFFVFLMQISDHTPAAPHIVCCFSIFAAGAISQQALTCRPSCNTRNVVAAV